MRIHKILILLSIIFLAPLHLSAQENKQEDKDSLVVLLSSKSAQMVDVEGARYRKVVGPARFLHNNTYLICDTAYWNVETQIIDAWGNVSILQDETVLTSEKLKYLIEEDLAQFRGAVVQLTDKDHNTLRTRHLDYNTKDSVAVFMNGGAMRDKDGQIIESRSGTYDSKIKTFVFENDVNMFTDSIFVKTRELVYESDLDLATFGHSTDAWKDDNMLSSNRGWYDRGVETFFFTDNVHVMTEDQEGWSDSLFFYRNTSDVEMLGNAQVSDTTRNVFALAGRIHYMDSLSKITLTRKPAVISQTEEEDGSIDTVYLGAEKLVYYTLKKCDISESVIADAEARLSSLDVDPVGTFRKKAAEEAAKAAEEEAKKDPNYRPQGTGGKGAQPGPPGGNLPAPGQGPSGGAGKRMAQPSMARGSAAPPSDSLTVDSLSVAPMAPSADELAMLQKTSVSDSVSVADSLAGSDLAVASDSLAVSDSLATPGDTTKIGFLEAIGKVKIYKKTMQVSCDSLLYCDLDSLARLFKEPLIWQEITRQYSADSVTVVVNDGAMEKASLMSNAFIVIQEDTSHYDQIKGAEMMAYFDEKGGLKRFDVLGGASALFFLEENGSLATVNKTESKMLSATFKDGEIQRIYYFEAPKNDGYPVVQLEEDERKLKGFNWQPERRPADRNAVTPLSLRPSERLRYSARPRTEFRQTDIYFPGYMNDVYRQIEVRDSLRKVRERERAIAEREAEERARLDSLAITDSLAIADSISLADSLADSLAIADSLVAVSDSLTANLSDSLAVVDSVAVADSIAITPENLTPEEIAAKEKAEAEAEKQRQKEEKERLKAEKKAALEEKKKKKQEEREARWAELDKRDAEKAAKKEAKRLEKERKHKRKALEDAAKQAEKDMQTLEKYRKKYARKKAAEDAKTAKKAAKKASDRK